MLSQAVLHTALSKTQKEFRRMFGDSLVSVILYGSYARGDFNEESDVDVAVIVDDERENLQARRGQLVRWSEAMDMQYGVMLAPCIIPYKEFLQYKDDLPYYQSIAREGVRLVD